MLVNHDKRVSNENSLSGIMRLRFSDCDSISNLNKCIYRECLNKPLHVLYSSSITNCSKNVNLTLPKSWQKIHCLSKKQLC